MKKIIVIITFLASSLVLFASSGINEEDFSGECYAECLLNNSSVNPGFCDKDKIKEQVKNFISINSKSKSMFPSPLGVYCKSTYDSYSKLLQK